MRLPATVRGVSFDFYNTLVHTGPLGGRGKRFERYLAQHGLTAQPWEHRVLYNVFGVYAERYRADATHVEQRAAWVEFTRRLFERVGVEPAVPPEEHADAIGAIFGSGAVRVFADAIPTMARLRDAGYRVGIISNWPPGLEAFCAELGLGRHADAIVGSGDLGVAKPSPRIFARTLELMGLKAPEVVHVGDHPTDDVAGALFVGMHAILVERPGLAPPSAPTITGAGPPRETPADLPDPGRAPVVDALSRIRV